MADVHMARGLGFDVDVWSGAMCENQWKIGYALESVTRFNQLLQLYIQRSCTVVVTAVRVRVRVT